MAVFNLSAANKSARAAAINTSIGASGNMLIYSGTMPTGPDATATGTLLATLPLSATAAVASLAIGSLVLTAGGTGYTNGTAVTFTGGGGTGAAATIVVSGGVITGFTITNQGSGYTSAPTVSFTGGTGATATVVMTGTLLFNAIAQQNATTSGTAGYARIQTSGAVGVVDLDVGTTGTSIIINTTSIVSGGPVVVSSAQFIEA